PRTYEGRKPYRRSYTRWRTRHGSQWTRNFSRRWPTSAFVTEPLKNTITTLVRSSLLVAAVACLQACAHGAPIGFSAGDRWTLPLKQTPQGYPFVVDVTLRDRGPYLFFLS